MLTAQFRSYHEVPAKVRAMAGFPLPVDANDRPEREGRDGLGPFDTGPDKGSAAEQRERAAQRIAALGEMTGGIAHDFRNILAVIESALRLAEKNSEAPERVRAYIAGARDGVDRGLKLISQLLHFAKQHELEARAENVNELLRTLELFLRYGAGSGTRIVLELAPELPDCLVDASQFNAAVLNLVVNARDAMPNGGEVQISTERCEVKTATPGSPAPRAYVRVRVQDSGQGMSADVVQKIFDPLFTTKGEKGTGLGLPQVCAFIRLIGGHIDVVSEPGIGTTFDLLFPIVHPDAAPRPFPQRTPISAANSPLSHDC